MEQRSDEWYEARRGKMTSSELAVIAEAVKGSDGNYEFKPTKGTITYLEKKVAERLTGIVPDMFQSYDMERGMELEPVAVQEICDKEGINGAVPGFVTYNDYAGGSPDYIGFKEGKKIGVEIKCPKQNTHVKYVMNVKELKDLRAIDKDYYWQVISLMLFTNTDIWYWVSYHPDFPTKYLHYIKVNREDVAEEIDQLAFGLSSAANMIDEMLKNF